MTYLTYDKKIVNSDLDSQGHLEAHPEVLMLLKEAISKIIIGNADTNIKYETEIDLGRVVGKTGLVEDTESKKFTYRIGRKFASRVSLRKKMEDSSTISVVLKFSKKNNLWNLITAFIGKLAPDEPLYFENTNSQEYLNSLIFWSRYALAYNSKTMSQVFDSSWEKERDKRTE